MPSSSSSSSSSSLSSPSPSLKPPKFLSSDFDASSTCTNNNHHDSPTATRTRRRIDMMDSKIVKACNELIQEQTNSARLRAEQQTEYRIALQKYQEIHQRWSESYKVPSGTTKSNIMMTKNTSSSSSSILGGGTFAIHQEAVAAAFEEEEHDSSTESKKNSSMSPYLLTRLSNLCYHVHLMTLLETYAETKIHEEYRVNIIWWIHEYWEQLEKETTKLNLQKEQAMADLNGIQHQHKTKQLLLDQEYQQNKKYLLEKAIPQVRGGELVEDKNSQIVEAGG